MRHKFDKNYMLSHGPIISPRLFSSISFIHYLVRTRSTEHVDTLKLVREAETLLAGEVVGGTLAVKAGVELRFHTFGEHEVIPSVITVDGVATTDAVDIFCFSCASTAVEDCYRAGRCGSDHCGAEQ